MSDPWNTFDLNGDGKTDTLERAFEAHFINEVILGDDDDSDYVPSSGRNRHAGNNYISYKQQLFNIEGKRTREFVKNELPLLKEWLSGDDVKKQIERQEKYGFSCIDYKDVIISVAHDKELGDNLVGRTGFGSPVFVDFERKRLLWVWPETLPGDKKYYCSWSCANLTGGRISSTIYDKEDTGMLYMGTRDGDADFLWKMGRFPILRKEQQSGELFNKEKAESFLEKTYEKERKLYEMTSRQEYEALLLERIRRARTDIASGRLYTWLAKFMKEGYLEEDGKRELVTTALSIPGMPHMLSLDGLQRVIADVLAWVNEKKWRATEEEKNSLEWMVKEGYYSEEEEVALWKQMLADHVWKSREEQLREKEILFKKKIKAGWQAFCKKHRALVIVTAVLLSLAAVTLTGWLIFRHPILYRAAEYYEENGQSLRAAILYGRAGEYEDAAERSYALWRERYPEVPLAYSYGHLVALTQEGKVLITDTGKGTSIVQWPSAIQVYTTGATQYAVCADGTVRTNGRDFVSSERARNIYYERWMDENNIISPHQEIAEMTGVVAILDFDLHGDMIALRKDGTLVIAGLREGMYDYGTGEKTKERKWLEKQRDVVDVVSAYGNTAVLYVNGEVTVYYGKNPSVFRAANAWSHVTEIAADMEGLYARFEDGHEEFLPNDYKPGERIKSFRYPPEFVWETDGEDPDVLGRYEDEVEVDVSIVLNADGTLTFSGDPFWIPEEAKKWTGIWVPEE